MTSTASVRAASILMWLLTARKKIDFVAADRGPYWILAARLEHRRQQHVAD